MSARRVALAGYAVQLASLAPLAWLAAGGAVAEPVWRAAAGAGLAGVAIMLAAGGLAGCQLAAPRLARLARRAGSWRGAR